MKLVVLDANAYWTEQLFKNCPGFSDLLLLKPRDFRSHRRLFGSYRSAPGPRKVADRVWEQTLSMPPGWMVGTWFLAARRFEKAIRAFAGGDPFALAIVYPQYRSLFHSLRPNLSIYYNFDDYRDNWPKHRDKVPAWEAETVAMADETICIAAHRAGSLAGSFPDKRGHIHHLPLGVTSAFMSREAGEKKSPTSQTPTAGYVGALNYRFDFAFLAGVASRLPDVSFVLGGRVVEDGDANWRAGLDLARKQPNIRFLGWVEHARLPEHLAGFDVLLMPYSHCNFNTNACPAKLWDYMGTGKPIVANDANPETLMWSEVVRIGRSPEEFAAAIREALAQPDLAMAERRLEIAAEHTWEKLGLRLSDILAKGREKGQVRPVS